jgi:UDP-glucose 4-epimerase
MNSTDGRPLISGKRILVTGGAGFIGSHIADALVSDNEVVILDDLSTGSLDNVPSEAEFVEGDVRDREAMSSVMEGVDIVFHHAAIVSVEQSVEDPELTHDVTTRATIQLLEFARRESARVILASSAAVYGQPESVPITETDQTEPTSPYGLAKLHADQYVRLYAELYNVEAIPLRYFNVYGPRQTAGDYSGVISIFLEQAQAGGPITVHGDGTQTRDFVHVSDVVQANLLAATEGTPGTAYNIGTGETISILELAETIREAVATEVPIRIEHIDKREGDIDESQAAIGRATDDLGFRPTIRLQDGLADLV